MPHPFFTSMSIQERDFILRMIQQLAHAIARIGGLRTVGKHHEALELLKETCDGILGPMARMIDQVDTASAAMLLATPAKIRAYASLVHERARIRTELGEHGRAQADQRRALDLYLLSLPGPDDIPGDVLSSIRELAPAVDASRLDPRARALLESIGGETGPA